MQNNKQDEKQVHYEQKPDEVKPDYTPQRTYESQSSDRRDFLKRTGTAVVVGLGGILLGKTALADGIDGIVGEEGNNTEFKKVTEGYYNAKCDPTPCTPNCTPPGPPCTPSCNPNCEPDCRPYSPPKCPPPCGPIEQNNRIMEVIKNGKQQTR